MKTLLSTMVVMGLLGGFVIGCDGGGSGGSGHPGPSPSTSSTGSSGGTTTPGQTLTSWAIGTWFAPEYDNGEGKHVAPKGLGINSDGTWTHNTSGVEDDKGTWTMSGDVVSLTGGKINDSKLDRGKNCTFMNHNDGNRIDTYYRDDFPAACQDKPPALTAVEKCLVGEFKVSRNYNTSITNFTTTRTPYRTQVFGQISVGNGDTVTTTIQYWTVEGGKLCTEGVDRKPGCSTIDWAEINSSRQGSKDPGCVEP